MVKKLKCIKYCNLILVHGFLNLIVLCAFSQSEMNGGISVSDFRHPENINKPLTWWHWINGNVTKDGIKKDLEDMKRVGIAGVQLFNTHMYLPKGPVRYGTNNWHEHVQYAIGLCDSLGLEFYMVNSPGWSGSGGPWISLEQSMKQLVYSETTINGTTPSDVELSQPYRKAGFYQDVAILAIPSNEYVAEYQSIQVLGENSQNRLPYLMDDDLDTFITFNPDKKATIDITFKSEKEINTMLLDLDFSDLPSGLAGRVEASEDGHLFNEITSFNFENHEGRNGNFVIPFPNTTPKHIRIKFDNNREFGDDIRIKKITFKRLNGVPNWDKKTAMMKAPLSAVTSLDTGNTIGLSVEQILDVTNMFNPRTNILSWSPPPGKWTILRFGYTTTGKMIYPAPEEGEGYEVDKLDPNAIEFQFNQSLGRIIKDAGSKTGKAFKGIVFDSFEGGYQNWTDRLPEMFKEENGYDLKTYLPAFTGRTIISTAITEAFLWDFRQTITKLIAKNYRGTMQQLAHQHNLQVFSETQGGPMSPALGTAYVDVPMNEFWTDGIEKRRERIKQTTSIANILGRKVVAAESFTSKPEYGKWQNVPRNLKRIGDYAFAAGINKFIFHTYTHQPYEVSPGFTMGRYGTHFGRTNTWWKYADSWMSYLARSQYLLQQGNPVVDVCYLYPEDEIYEALTAQPEIPEGFTFDIIYPSYLMNMKAANQKAVMPSGASYQLIVLPNYPLMKFETLKKISELLKNGAMVVGSPPIAPPDLKGTSEYYEAFTHLVRQLWGDVKPTTQGEIQYGKGRLYWGKTIAEVLESIQVLPDVEFDGARTDSLMFTHRTTSKNDIYFISNQAGGSRLIDAYFRVVGKQPEIWNAKTGERWDIPVFDTIGNRTVVPLQLQSNESAFVVFSKPLPDKWISSVSLAKQNSSSLLPLGVQFKNGVLVSNVSGIFTKHYNTGEQQQTFIRDIDTTESVNTPWKLVMQKRPLDTIRMDKLTLWNEYSDPNIRYYAGEGVYFNDFKIDKQLSKNERVLLDLGEIYDLAVVYINRKRVTTVWEHSDPIDISALLKKGRNSIEVRVVSRWVNRLIGDDSILNKLRYDEKGSIFTKGKLLELPEWLTKPVIGNESRPTFTTWKHYDAQSTLVPSGFKGPVRLLFYNVLSNTKNNNDKL